MGRPQNTVDRAEELHATLIAAGQVGKRIPGPTWNRIICKQWRVSIEMAHKVTQTGATLGFWRRGRDPLAGPYVEVLPPEVVLDAGVGVQEEVPAEPPTASF